MTTIDLSSIKTAAMERNITQVLDESDQELFVSFSAVEQAVNHLPIPEVHKTTLLSSLRDLTQFKRDSDGPDLDELEIALDLDATEGENLSPDQKRARILAEIDHLKAEVEENALLLAHKGAVAVLEGLLRINPIMLSSSELFSLRMEFERLGLTPLDEKALFQEYPLKSESNSPKS